MQANRIRVNAPRHRKISIVFTILLIAQRFEHVSVSFVRFEHIVAVLVYLVHGCILHLLVFSSSIPKHVNTTTPLYLVLGQVVFFMSTYSVSVSDGELVLCLQVVVL